LPLFAPAAGGVWVGGAEEPLIQPVSIGIVVGLCVGKIAGVLGATALMTRFTPLRLPDSIGLRDLIPVGMLTGIGFTVALLIAELCQGRDPRRIGDRSVHRRRPAALERAESP